MEKKAKKPLRGAKLEPQPTNSQRIREIDVDLKNLQVASRINQMMTQQVLQNIKGLSEDLAKAYGLISELQYKLLAMQKVGTFDADALNKKAEDRGF
jgi:hypothetical protein